MSKHAATLINAVHNIELKSYLELGTAGGRTFNAVRASDKCGVDMAHRPEGMTGSSFHMKVTTDEFFAKLPAEARYDVIFIDADHSYDSVRRDYNNAMKYLVHPGGLLLIHDLVPPDEAHTAPNLCGDGFRFLVQLGSCDPPMAHVEGDYGLTCMWSWRSCNQGRIAEFPWMKCYAEFPFESFTPPPLKPLPDMIEWVKNR